MIDEMGLFRTQLRVMLDELKHSIITENSLVREELHKMRVELVEQLTKLIDAQTGHISAGYIPIETYKEHIEAYKETYRFFARLAAITIISIFGLTKLAPEILAIIFKAPTP